MEATLIKNVKKKSREKLKKASVKQTDFKPEETSSDIVLSDVEDNFLEMPSKHSREQAGSTELVTSGIEENCTKTVQFSNEEFKPLDVCLKETLSLSAPEAESFVSSKCVGIVESNMLKENAEKVIPERLEHDVVKTQPLHMYPDLKLLHQCEEMQNIITSQTVVKTMADKFNTKMAIEANKSFQDFIKDIEDVEKHPLMERVNEYFRARKSYAHCHSRLKYLISDVYRKDDALWKNITKEASAKGKCADGNFVAVKETYNIKELDEEKFLDIIKSMNEMEELWPLHAFHAYSKEFTRLKIDHFTNTLISKEETHGFENGSGNYCHKSSLKKCISVLFHSQRQNVQDEHYLNTCQGWLKSLVSQLMTNENFEDTLFIINHVIRCPNGIINWAVELIQLLMKTTKTEECKRIDSISAQQILLALYLILNPVPLKEFFLKSIKELPSSADAKFTVLDSEGEEEESFEMSKKFSDADLLSLLNQIPVRSLYKHFLFDEANDSGKLKIKMLLKGELLNLFAYSTSIIDVLFNGLGTYYSESFELLFESISNLIRHIVLYISKYWTETANTNSHFKSELQAIYDKLFFHIVFKVYNFEKIHIWRILPELPYDHISEKMLWNIMWVFFSPGRQEEQIYSEKDVEIKIKDESVESILINHIKDLPVQDLYHLLNAIEKIIKSSKSIDEDFIKFAFSVIFKITVLEPSLSTRLSNEGLFILQDIAERFPYLVSELLQKIEEKDNYIANYCLRLFKRLSLLNWVPEDVDICKISLWLMANQKDGKHQLACLILKNMNWDYDKEGSLFLPYDLHKRIAVIVCEAYVRFDANTNNESLVSKGVKQVLQFTSMGSENYEFVQWAWNVLFYLKLHPLDRKYPPWVEVYDGYVETNKSDLSIDFLQPLLLLYEDRHPSACYLMLLMSNEGNSLKGLLNGGLECFSALVDSEQYMAAIKSLYYILPFFVKNSEELLEKTGFLKALNSLIIADLTVISISRGAVVGVILHKLAAIIKYQIYQAAEHTVECATPLLKLWIKVLLKILTMPDNSSAILKGSAKQVYFLLDVCMKISFLHDYSKECILDLLSSYCNPSSFPKAPPSSFWNRLFSSSSSIYPILNRCTVPEYPWLAWYVLFAEMKQKYVDDLWLKVCDEMVKSADGSPAVCLKKVSEMRKVELDFLPIYRWAIQALETSVSHPVSPLIWQQFFTYFFQRVPLPNSENCSVIGTKYFKHGEYATLLRKMNIKLSNILNYYRNLCKTIESEATGESEKDYNSSLYFNLERLFKAFKLWIEDESLQNFGLCLSALDPKYCTYRLKLILDGDKRVWFDLVSSSALKDEINQKVHSWCFSGRVNEVIHCQSQQKEESLSQMLTRHTEIYENLLHIQVPNPVSGISLDNHYMAVASKDAVVQMIEQNQSIIFEKARYFCDQISKYKQQHSIFINWTPQLYEIEDCEVTTSKICQKGSGANGCSGAAYFKLPIKKCKKNEGINERLNSNRINTAMTERILFDLEVTDLCMASLKIENCIRSLAGRMKEAAGDDANYLKQMGIALFYHQISTIEKIITSVANYPPSRQFYSSIIESLGEEFIDGDDSELVNLAEAILNHPESGSLALPLFNPNKASIENFLNVYKTLTSSVVINSPSTLLALFSKIDFSQWLNDHTPSFDVRKTLFNKICNAIFQCGYSCSTELLPVCDILKRHFGIILKYMFPDMFLLAVSFLLKGMENGNLCKEVFYEAFHCFGCPLFTDKTNVEDIEFSLKKFAQNQQLPADQKIFVSVAQLNLQQVAYVSHELYSHFIKNVFNVELYKRYAAYMKPIPLFLAIISHSVVALHLDEFSSVNEKICISDLWKTFHLPFLPWLYPAVNNSGLNFPWTNEEIDDASYMFKIFIAGVKYFHGQTLGLESEESVMSCMWSCYVEKYVSPGYRHYSASLCHTELLNLPWHEFYPGPQDIEGMCKVLQSNLDESKEFLSKISLKIPWTSVMHTISLTKSPDYVGKVLATLGKLLIISQLDCAETESTLDPRVFKEIENLSWHFVAMEDVEILLELCFSKLDPFLLISNWNNGPESHVLHFLKLICCWVPNSDVGEYANSKRIAYLKKFITTLSICCSSKTSQISKLLHNFSDIISSLFEEIKAIICSVSSPNEQISYALPLIKEVVVLLNNLPKGELDHATLNSVTAWLSMNRKSPLLLPSLKVSCQNLNSVSHMVPLVECCITTRFKDENLNAQEALNIWHLISSYFCVSPNVYEEFVKKCVENNAFLALHCCILHRLPHSASTESKKLLLEQIIKWIRESELRIEAEAKFILIWDKLLEISVKLVSELEYEVVKQVLTSFCWMLETFAQDRSNAGFFAIIGFGQTSSLSVNFRFLSRVMAAFLQYQVPPDKPIRIEPTEIECLELSSASVKQESSTSQCVLPASKALESLQALQLKKSYAALHSQIDYAAKCVADPKYTLLQSRELLKYFAVNLYPKDSFLSALDT